MTARAFKKPSRSSGDSEKILNKYLSRYAQPECTHLKDLPNFSRQHVIVIPCYDESGAMIDRLLAHPDASNLLVVLVVNQPRADAYQMNENNSKLLTRLADTGKLLWSNAHLSIVKLGALILLVANQSLSDTAIPVKQGVGCARKIGADIAAKLIKDDFIEEPIIYNTDADATLPNNYFQAPHTQSTSNVSAWVYHYRHSAAKTATTLATLIYECAIKYYKTGLRWAGSPYAFHTLGSTVAVDVLAYAKVRGFPKIAAGEDFYILNKLAKIGDIASIDNCAITLDSRISNRVPYGTGPSIVKILGANNFTESEDMDGLISHLKNFPTDRPESLWAKKINHDYYDPTCFAILSELLASILSLYQRLGVAKESDAPLVLETPFTPHINAALMHLGYAKFSKHAKKQCGHYDQFKHHFHTWFDALKTLQFIRYLREHNFADQPFHICLQAYHRFQLATSRQT